MQAPERASQHDQRRHSQCQHYCCQRDGLLDLQTNTVHVASLAVGASGGSLALTLGGSEASGELVTSGAATLNGGVLNVSGSADNSVGVYPLLMSRGLSGSFGASSYPNAANFRGCHWQCDATCHLIRRRTNK